MEIVRFGIIILKFLIICKLQKLEVNLTKLISIVIFSKDAENDKHMENDKIYLLFSLEIIIYKHM